MGKRRFAEASGTTRRTLLRSVAYQFGSDMSRATLLLLLVLLAGCGLRGRTPTHPANETDVDPQLPVGPFSLTERGGKTVTDRDLRGSVWVASFVFTRCTGPCPAVSSTVARLQQDFKDEPGVKFVTFTVDPARDDLSALREYAAARNADPDRWLFLTGDEKAVHEILREQFKQAIEQKTENVKPGDEFLHDTRLMVVDRSGVVRGIYAGLPDEKALDPKGDFDANLARLRARVRELLR